MGRKTAELGERKILFLYLHGVYERPKVYTVPWGEGGGGILMN